jgi:hypothetical protein
MSDIATHLVNFPPIASLRLRKLLANGPDARSCVGEPLPHGEIR